MNSLKGVLSVDRPRMLNKMDAKVVFANEGNFDCPRELSSKQEHCIRLISGNTGSCRSAWSSPDGDDLKLFHNELDFSLYRCHNVMFHNL